MRESNSSPASVSDMMLSPEQQKELFQQIETLRQRTKDNKAHNVEFFLSQSFASLEHIRNLLITLSMTGIGLLYTKIITASPNIGRALFWSIVIGCASYIFQFLSQNAEADYYSKKERIFVNAYPTLDQYKQMMIDESNIKKDAANIFRGLSLLLLLIQIGFLIYATYLLTSMKLIEVK